MKPTAVMILSAILFTSGCAATQPASTPTPKPTSTDTPVPSPTPGLSGTVLPDPVLEITNETSPLKAPYGVAIGSGGRVYVNDAGNSRVLVFDNAGTLVEEWNKKGSGDGEFNSLRFGGIAVDADGNVFVVDKSRNSILRGSSLQAGEPARISAPREFLRDSPLTNRVASM